MPVSLAAFAVTGSYLERSDPENALPISFITADELTLRGGATPCEWLSSIAAASRMPITESQASGADARGDIAAVSLRGLGSGNTLVLVNGRRIAPHPISMPEGTSGVPSMATNVNVLPGAAIARIEVLRDGASALYGSDAAAGVINTILRRDTRGGRWSARFLDTQHGGGTEYRGMFAGGITAPGGRSSLGFSYEYLHRDEIANRDRAFARSADFRARAPDPWNGTTPELGADLRSDRGFFGRFQRGSLAPDGSFAGARPAGVAATQVAANGTFYLVPASPGATTRTLQATEPDRSPTSPTREYFLNVNAFRFLLPSTDRHNLHLSFDQRLPGELRLFAETTYYRADSHNQREPSRIDAIADNNLTVAVDNPYNPFGSRFYSPTGAPNPDGTPRLTGTPSEVILTRLSLPEFGARQIDVRSENVRAVAGLRGAFAAHWKWESALLYSTAKATDRESRAIKESELRDALARTSTATALNPFLTTFAVANGALTTSGTSFTNPESVIAPLRGTFYREGNTALGSWDFRVNGQLPGLPAGAIGLAAGTEYRRETYTDYRDAESGRLTAADVQRLGLRAQLAGDNNFIQVSPTDNTDARRNVAAAFTEIIVPVYRDEAHGEVRSLEVSAAARFEHTSNFGRTTKPRVGFIARLLPSTTVRGSISDAFRAPNLASLFSGGQERSITGVTDAYRSAVTGSSDDGPTARRVSLRSGNTALTPEKARTYTVGVVLTPRALRGLSLTIDAWAIDQTDGFGRLDAPDILAQDTALLLAANAARSATSPVPLDLAAAGSAHILRNPVTIADQMAFLVYNLGRPPNERRAPVGTIRAIAESYLNASRRQLSGFDFGVAYRTSPSALGTFHTALEAAYLRKFDEQLSAGAPSTDLSWRDGNTHWKGSVTLGWRGGNWSAAAFTTYTGRTQDAFLRTTAYASPAVSADGFLIVDASWLTNLSVTRHFTGNGLFARSSVRVGVNNLFDAEPSFGIGSSSDTDGFLRGFGDPRGRAFSVEISKRF